MDEFKPSLYSHAKCKAHYVASMVCIVRCRRLKRERELNYLESSTCMGLHHPNRGCTTHFCGDYKVMVSPVAQIIESGLMLSEVYCYICMQDSQIMSLQI